MRVVSFLLLVCLILPFSSGAFAGDDDAPTVKASPATDFVDKYLTAPAERRAAVEAEFLAMTPEQQVAVLSCLRERLRSASAETTPVAPALPTPEGGAGVLVNLSFQFLDADEATTSRLLSLLPAAGGPGSGGSAKGQTVRFLDDTEVEVLLRAAMKSQGLKTLSAPRITTYDKQPADISILNQTSYVKDYEVVGGKDGSKIADPVVGVLDEGLVIHVLPTVSADKKYVSLELTLTNSNLVKPIPEFKTKASGTDLEVTIQIPEVHVTKRSFSLTIPSGGHVLLTGARDVLFDDGRSVLVLVDADAWEGEGLVPSNFKPPEEPKPPAGGK